MICLDSSRNIIHDSRHIVKSLVGKEFLVIDNVDSLDYHFEPYSSDNLIYLGEMDFFYSINDLDKGLLFYAPIRNGNDTVSWMAGPLASTVKIPNLWKILKNKDITKTNASTKIKERDGYCCQLCGETDCRVLNVHHIVPRISPFIDEKFIHSPINQITLCANCHRIEHYVLQNGSESERKEHVTNMLRINGYPVTDTLNHSFYIKMSDLIEFKD